MRNNYLRSKGKHNQGSFETSVKNAKQLAYKLNNVMKRYKIKCFYIVHVEKDFKHLK